MTFEMTNMPNMSMKQFRGYYLELVKIIVNKKNPNHCEVTFS